MPNDIELTHLRDITIHTEVFNRNPLEFTRIIEYREPLDYLFSFLALIDKSGRVVYFNHNENDDFVAPTGHCFLYEKPSDHLVISVMVYAPKDIEKWFKNPNIITDCSIRTYQALSVHSHDWFIKNKDVFEENALIALREHLSDTSMKKIWFEQGRLYYCYERPET
jgi:hypothetical protein